LKNKKYTDKDAHDDLVALRDSCSEGLSGEWDCSTEEGRQGFKDMGTLVDRVAKHFGIKL
jgi:hypothetical protein